VRAGRVRERERSGLGGASTPSPFLPIFFLSPYPLPRQTNLLGEALLGKVADRIVVRVRQQGAQSVPVPGGRFAVVHQAGPKPFHLLGRHDRAEGDLAQKGGRWKSTVRDAAHDRPAPTHDGHGPVRRVKDEAGNIFTRHVGQLPRVHALQPHQPQGGGGGGRALVGQVGEGQVAVGFRLGEEGFPGHVGAERGGATGRRVPAPPAGSCVAAAAARAAAAPTGYDGGHNDRARGPGRGGRPGLVEGWRGWQVRGGRGGCPVCGSAGCGGRLAIR